MLSKLQNRHEERHIRLKTRKTFSISHKKGIPRKVWKQVYHNVEALDCFVYAYAAAVLKGLSRMTDDGWDQLEGIILGAGDEGETTWSKARKKVVVKSNFLKG